MKRNEISKMQLLFSKGLESVITGDGEPVRIHLYYDANAKRYFQLQDEKQGEHYRETTPLSHAHDVKSFGEWLLLEK